VIEAVVDPVDDRPVGEERGKAASARLEQVLLAADVQIALVLTRKACSRQVFRRRRAAYGNCHIAAVLLLELLVGASDRLAQLRRSRRCVHDLARPRGTLREECDIGLVDLIECRMQRLPRLRGSQGVAVSLREDGKAVRDAYTLGR